MPKRSESNSMMWIVVLLVILAVLSILSILVSKKSSEETYDDKQVIWTDCGTTCPPTCTRLKNETCFNLDARPVQFAEKEQCECPITKPPIIKTSGCGNDCPKNCTEIKRKVCYDTFNYNLTCQCPA